MAQSHDTSTSRHLKSVVSHCIHSTVAFGPADFCRISCTALQRWSSELAHEVRHQSTWLYKNIKLPLIPLWVSARNNNMSVSSCESFSCFQADACARTGHDIHFLLQIGDISRRKLYPQRSCTLHCFRSYRVITHTCRIGVKCYPLYLKTKQSTSDEYSDCDKQF